MRKTLTALLYVLLLLSIVAWTPITTYRPVQVLYNVNVRNSADVVVGWLKPNDIIMALCYGGKCYLDNGYTVHQGCTSAALPGSKCRGRK